MLFSGCFPYEEIDVTRIHEYDTSRYIYIKYEFVSIERFFKSLAS